MEQYKQTTCAKNVPYVVTYMLYTFQQTLTGFATDALTFYRHSAYWLRPVHLIHNSLLVHRYY